MKRNVLLVVSATICLLVGYFYKIGSGHGENRKSLERFVRDKGYPYQVHKVVTDDGYILSLHRIPGSKKGTLHKEKLPVLLVHGLMSSAIDYLWPAPAGLGFFLADEGHDVWLLDCRGTSNSQNHTKLSSSSSEFWDFSWHEIGVYDLSATIDHILKSTGHKQIYHIGLSQGTTTFYVLMAERPEYNNKVKAHVAYAPTAVLCNAKFENRLFSIPEKWGLYTKISKLVGHFNVGNNIMQKLSMGLCLQFRELCIKQFFYNIGITPEQSTKYVKDHIFDNHPEGASQKQFIHYSQLINNCEFRPYIQPEQQLPPLYKFENIKVPIYAFIGILDRSQNPRDTLVFRSKLTNGFKETNMIHEWGHGDFLFGKDRVERVYKRTLQIINET